MLISLFFQGCIFVVFLFEDISAILITAMLQLAQNSDFVLQGTQAVLVSYSYY